MQERLLKKWVDERLISPEQAERMLADIRAERSERRSGRFIVAISTIGAVLVGASAILFIASNWQQLSALVKLSLMVAATLTALFGGYYLKYEKGQLERVGGAILLLAALMFGATIMLTAQIYHVQANHQGLVLVWLAGMLPLVYGTRTTPMAVLASGLLFLWLGLYLFSNPRYTYIPHMALLFAGAGLAVFGVGGVHYRLRDMDSVARAIRLAGLKVVLAVLFIMTLAGMSGSEDTISLEQWRSSVPPSLIGVHALALLGLLMNGWLRRSDAWARVESLAGAAITALLLLFLWFPYPSLAYLVGFNLLFALLVLLLIYYGYARADIRIVNMGIFWLSLFLLAKYFDWFWSLLDRATFFFVGGVILVVGGVLLEKQRRRIKSRLRP